MILRVRDLDAGYGEIQVLWGVDIDVDKEEIVSLLGPNGAGKTTLTRVIMGLLKPIKGSLHFMGRDITNTKPYERVRLGIEIVPEGRRLFPHLTVRENLYVGMYSLKKVDKDSLDMVFDLFLRLKERINQKAGTLSGGEQQMLAIARALVSKPKLLILDEPSQGLAPKIVEQIFEVVRKLKHDYGISVLLIDQFVRDALRSSERTYIMRSGRIVFSGSSSELAANEKLISMYLG